MALRSTFSQVVQAVRDETRQSSNSSRGIDMLDHIKQVVRRHYYSLAEDFDWEHLRIRKETAVSRKQLQAGDRYYNFPTALNPLRIERAWIKWGGSWAELTYGIGYQEYTAQDPDDDKRSDPVRNWAFYNGGEQFEVWPIPATNGAADGNNEIAFEGQKLVERLVLDSNRLDMDDMLVYLRAAAEILAEHGQDKAAAIKAAEADKRLLLTHGQLSSQRRWTVGAGRIGAAQSYPRQPKFIRA